MSEIVSTAEYDFKSESYSRFSLSLALKILINEVLTPDFPFKVDELFSGLPKDDTLLLILRDAYKLSIYDLASAFTTSEGSIRTRLMLAREKVFSSSSTLTSSKYEVEDADLGADLTQLKGKQFELRLKSVQTFSNYTEPVVPANLLETLKPALVEKKGDKVKLNLATAPWYYKIIFEAVLSIVIVATIVIAMPKIKKTYEFWIERRLDIYNFAETKDDDKNNSDKNKNAEKTRDPVPLLPDPVTITPQVTQTTLETEFSSKNKDFNKAAADKIYRISIKTDVPELARKNIQTLLHSSLGVTPKSGIMGSDLPGGILFDVYIPLDQYKTTKDQLTQMGQTNIIETRSKQEKIIRGNAHLKIWLQRQ